MTKRPTNDDEEESAKPEIRNGIYYAATREAEEQG